MECICFLEMFRFIVFCGVLWASVVGSSPCARKDKVQMTVMSFKPRNSESTVAPLPHYECYLGAGDEDADVLAVRAYDTRNGMDQNPDPPSNEIISGLPLNTAAYTISLDTSNNNAFGVFNCTAVKAGSQDTTIMTMFIRSDSYAVPATGLYTQTVDVGDDMVFIDMNYTTGTSDIRWRINASLNIPEGGPEDINNNEAPRYLSEDYNLIRTRPVSIYDDGLYEVNRFAQRNAFQAMQRLIVRACVAGKWGPPGCTGVCDNCYNGGVCDDETGRCICPPGFMGTNCLIGCGGNKFGYFCEFQCEAGGSEDGCHERLFCLLDPFGCRCNTGFTGLNCDMECPMGTFGANCLEQCHCEGGASCDRFTGVCRTNCDSAYSGMNCQIPVTCPSGYYGSNCTSKCRCTGNSACDKDTGMCDSSCAAGSMLVDGSQACQECPDGYFGDSCTGECHCEFDACDKVTGECVGCCKNQWLDRLPQRCQEGLHESSFIKVNPGQQTTFTCKADVLDDGIYSIYLTASPDQARQSIDVTGTTFRSTSSRPGFRRWTRIITVPGVQPGDEYYCQLRFGVLNMNILAWRNTAFSTYIFPVLSAAPTAVNVNLTSVTITWETWNNENDVGDPPVESYTIYYKKSIDTDWIYGTTVGAGGMLQYLMSGLDKDTEYIFSVSAVRPGLGGEGPRGTPVTVKTLCEPPAAPIDVQTKVTDMQLLNISWKVPPGIICSTGITGYTIYYSEVDMPEDINHITVDDGTTTWSIVSALNPGSSYIFSISLTTDQESERSVSTSPVIFPEPLSAPSPGPDPGSGLPATVIIVIAVTLLAIIGAASIVCCFCRNRKQKEDDHAQTDAADNLYANTVNSGKPEEYLALNKTDISMTQSEYNHLNLGATVDQSYEVPGVAGLESDSTKHAKNTRETTSAKFPSAGNRSEPIKLGSSTEYEYVPTDNTKEKIAINMAEPMEDIEDHEYEKPGDLAAYTGIYINTPRTTKPVPIKVSEFQEFMRKDKRELISEIVGQFMMLPKGKLYSCAEAAQHEKIRGGDASILPFDHSRIKLSDGQNKSLSDYYNASIVTIPNASTTFVAAKEPTGVNQASDFWRMIWQEGIKTIVMLHDVTSQYWPAKVQTAMVFGEFTVLWQKSLETSAYISRKLKLLVDDDETQMNVHQIQFRNWPKGGVPDNPTALVKLIHTIQDRQTKEKRAHMLVHCSDGSGVTGTFIAIYTLMELMQQERTINAFDVIKKLRKCRMDMVQTRIQYLFVYEALQEAQVTPRGNYSDDG